MSLWSFSELLKAFPQNIESETSSPLISGVSIDSRTLKKGDLFIALDGDPGPQYSTSVTDARDGHEFAGQAVSNGAAALLVSRRLETKAPQIVVENTLDAMWQLGQLARNRTSGKIVGITGSSGKTTVKTWLDQLLKKQGVTHSSIGSLNNHWGVPLSLSRMPQEIDYGIFEIGMNHPGEIAPLSKLVSPEVALVLNVLPAHIGNFADLTEIKKEKLSISQGLNKAGILIVPAELDLGDMPENKRDQRTVTFGLGIESGADVYGEAILSGDLTQVKASVRGQEVNYSLNVHGDHRVLSSLAVLAMIDCLGGDIFEAAKIFHTLTTPSGRGNMQTIAGINVIDDSYNANPVSMSYAIQALKSQPCEGRRIALLGEMLELGNETLDSHRLVADEARSLDGVITVGGAFKTMPGSWGHFDASEDLDVLDLLNRLSKGDTLLIKGSNKVFWQSGFVKKLIMAM